MLGQDTLMQSFRAGRALDGLYLFLSAQEFMSGGDKYLFCLLVWQPDVRGAGPDVAGAPSCGGALHPAFYQEHLEEQLPAGRSGGRAALAGLLWFRPRCPQHNGTVSEQGHSQVTAAPAPQQQEICEYFDLFCLESIAQN